MKRMISVLGGLLLVAASAQAADYKTLRNLTAAAPSQPKPLESGFTARPVQFARVVVAPKNGEAWALAYYSYVGDSIENPKPRLGFLNWSSGPVEADTPAFGRVFSEELKKAGFSTPESSLFSDGESGADLKVGVLIDDMKGRFCADCPNLFNRNGIPATVVMTANWEIYSALDRKVVAKITTTGGADYKTRLSNSVLPAIYEGFRENVRLLLADGDFRRVVTASPGARSPTSTPATPILFAPARAQGTISQSARAVAVVFAADGSGSGFLISSDGYLLTNQHVVGASKYVKLRWQSGAETLGEVIRTDSRRDVALVKVSATDLAPLVLRPTTPTQGEPVFAIGTPLDDKLQNTMTKGIVSAVRTLDGLPFIQSDVAINHGNSGGPLLDEKGQVIGIAVSGMAPAGSPVGLNFFIPIDDALRALALTPRAEPTPAASPAPAKSARK